MFLSLILLIFAESSQQVANVTVTTSAFRNDNQTTEVPVTTTTTSPTSETTATTDMANTTQNPAWNFKSSASEEFVKAGKKISLVCGSYKSFPVLRKWKKDEAELSNQTNERYTLSSDLQFLRISNVQYSDRAKFECIVRYENQTLTNTYTLRVRDPLGALWPFLGILIEAVILAITIVTYERLHTKKDTKKNKSEERNGVHVDSLLNSKLIDSEVS